MYRRICIAAYIVTFLAIASMVILVATAVNDSTTQSRPEKCSKKEQLNLKTTDNP